MPYDPAFPPTGAEIVSAEFRDQFNGLKALIDAVPAGPPGADGAPGADGNDGAPGPPFADAVVDGVTTLDPGQAATVGVSFDGTNVHFTYGIPRGNDGGSGSEGPQGQQGPPGEVTQAALNAAMTTVTNNSSGNTNGVALLNMTVSDPPTQSEMQTIANKIDEILTAQRRT